MVKKFTDSLDELFVKNNLSLMDSLKVMSNEGIKNNRLQRISEYVMESLLQGNVLSSALKTCPFVTFDSVYIAFVMLAEKTGNLKSTISFLKRKCDRECKIKEKILESSAYPLMVMVISVVGGKFLVDYSGRKIDGQMVFSIFMLFLIGIISFSIIFRCIKGNKISEVFFALDFLTKNGHSLSSACGFSILIVGNDIKLRKMLSEAKTRLEYGYCLSDSISLTGRLKELIFVAEKGGNQSGVFKTLADYQSEKEDKMRNVCLSLMEPLFLIIAGIFMLIIVIEIFMPFMTDMSWI